VTVRAGTTADIVSWRITGRSLQPRKDFPAQDSRFDGQVGIGGYLIEEISRVYPRGFIT
jgi:hypothetical protein